jgi:oligopeptidase B
MRHFVPVLALLAISVAARAIDPTVATPPVAKKVPTKLEMHGDVRIDDYFWIRDKTNKDVLAYLEAENAYTAAVMKPTKAFQETLNKEFLGRIKQTDQNVPVLDRGYRYYTRTEEGKQYPIRCRKKDTPDAPEEVLLDGNEMAKGEKFFSLGAMKVSPDSTRLAFATDTTGFREYMLSVKDLTTGKLIETKFVKATDFEWAEDGKTLFYVTEDVAKRPHKLWRHAIGTPKEKDVFVFEEKDELFELALSKTRDGKYLLSSSGSFTSSEVRFLSAADPAGEWKTVAKRAPDHEYSVDHRDGTFYIHTNKGATNFKVVTCPVEQTDPSGWKDLMPHDPQVFVQGVAVFKTHLVVSARIGGLSQIIVRNLATGATAPIEFKEAVYDVSLSDNPEFDTPTIRFSYTSLVTPDSEYEFNLKTGARKLLKRTEVPGGYDPDNYVSERVHATAQDGTSVPISIVYRKGVKRDGSAPCLLYAYGSYGITMPMTFDPVRVSLLDRGVVYAIGHIRGGSDLGRTWYDDGKMLKKMNTFTDFVACADYLVKQRYCARERLAIQGGSAGGLLIGVTVNLRPDLCKVAVLEVPFVDAITSMLDESLPLTTQEFQQWGNPKVRKEYDYIRQYCPYTNLKPGAYPSMLVTTSLNDSQVLFHEPTKYVAKLRALKTDKNPLLLKCNMDAGHGGASGRYDRLKEEALVTAFILDQVGISK